MAPMLPTGLQFPRFCDGPAHIRRPPIPKLRKMGGLQAPYERIAVATSRQRLDRLVSSLAGADAHHLVDREDEDLTVPYAAGSSSGAKCPGKREHAQALRFLVPFCSFLSILGWAWSFLGIWDFISLVASLHAIHSQPFHSKQKSFPAPESGSREAQAQPIVGSVESGKHRSHPISLVPGDWDGCSWNGFAFPRFRRRPAHIRRPPISRNGRPSSSL